MEHGTVLCYRKGGCRCELCRAAKKADKRRWEDSKAAKLAAGIPLGRQKIPLSERPHGSYVTYSKGCRCRPCTDAQADYGRERKAIRELKEFERTGLLGDN